MHYIRVHANVPAARGCDWIRCEVNGWSFSLMSHLLFGNDSRKEVSAARPHNAWILNDSFSARSTSEAADNVRLSSSGAGR